MDIKYEGNTIVIRASRDALKAAASQSYKGAVNGYSLNFVVPDFLQGKTEADFVGREIQIYLVPGDFDKSREVEANIRPESPEFKKVRLVAENDAPLSDFASMDMWSKF